MTVARLKKTPRQTYSTLLCVLILCSFTMAVQSYQPPRFNYQARLTDAGGAPLSGNHLVYFKLYQGGTAATANSGANVYAENANISATAGVVNHSVGTGNATSGTLTAGLFAFSGDMFLQVAVDTEANVILPRQRLEPVPFAIAAKQPSSFFGQFGGIGKDGDTTATGSLSGSRYEFSNLLIPSGTTVTASQTHTYIGVSGICKIAGALSAVGSGAKGGLTGQFGERGFDATTMKQSQPQITLCLSGAGGAAFSDGGGGSGGGAGNLGGAFNFAFPTSQLQYSLVGALAAGSGANKQDNFYLLLAYPGAGGGAGGNLPAGAPSGGAGGGVIYIECNELDLTGAVTAAGQQGIADTKGGGGGGGVVLIRARRINSHSGSVDVSGGAGASGSSPGFAGAAGFWDVVELP